MTWTLCTSGAAIAKAGDHADSTIVASGSTLLGWATEVEGAICTKCHVDFVGSLPSDTRIQNALADVCSSGVAMRIIAYAPDEYTTKVATLMLNFHHTIWTEGLTELKEMERQRLK